MRASQDAAPAVDGHAVERGTEQPGGGSPFDDRLHPLLDAPRRQELVLARRQPVPREQVAQHDREARVRRVDGQCAPTKVLEAADVGGGAEVEDRRALDLPDDDEVVPWASHAIRLSIAVRPRSHEPSMSFARCSVDERVRTVSISRAASSR